MIPTSLTLDNFASHIHSEVDFTKFDVSLIFGSFEGDPNISNGTGKSSILHAIRFVLFGKSNFNSKSKIVMRGKEVCQVEFIFSCDNEEYRIIRKLNAKTGSISVEFAKKENGNWNTEGLTCDTPSLTNEKIINLIGMNDDAFVNIVYFKQNDISGFTSATASKRKEVLKEILRINIWDEYQKVAKENEKKSVQDLEKIEQRIQVLEEIENNVSEIKKQINEKENDLLIQKTNNIETENSLKKITQAVIDLEINSKIPDKGVLENELERISSRGKQIVSAKNTLLGDLENYKNSINVNSKKMLELQKSLKNNYEIALQTNCDAWEELVKEAKQYFTPSFYKYDKEDLKLKKEQHDMFCQSLTSKRIELTNLLSLEPGEECPTCLSVMNNLEEIIKKREEKKVVLNKKINELEKLIKEKKEIINDIEKNIEKSLKSLIDIERTKLIMSKNNSEIDSFKKNIKVTEEELMRLAAEWKELKSKKESLVSIKDNEENVRLKDLINKKTDLEKRFSEAKENEIKLNLEIEYLGKQIEDFERKLSEKTVLSEDRNKIIDEISIYSKLSSAFGKDGIQAIIIENLTANLREYTNSILRKVYYKPVNVNFVTQKQTAGGWKEDFEILINIDNEEYDFESLSGGEQLRLSLAIRLALSQLLMHRAGSNVKFLLFDEIDQSLDKQGIGILSEIINELAKEFKILVISHNDYLKEHFNNVITVHMGQNGSVIR